LISVVHVTQKATTKETRDDKEERLFGEMRALGIDTVAPTLHDGASKLVRRSLLWPLSGRRQYSGLRVGSKRCGTRC
jgi:hypothetical protein